MEQVDQVTEVELEVEVMNMMNKLAIEGGGEGENRGCRQGGPIKLPGKGGGQQQRPGKAGKVGWEEGRNQRPQPLQELVLGGVLSPGEVSSPGLWPAVV